MPEFPVDVPEFPIALWKAFLAFPNALRAWLDHWAALARSGHFWDAMPEHLMAAIACSVAALATLNDSIAALAESLNSSMQNQYLSTPGDRKATYF